MKSKFEIFLDSDIILEHMSRKDKKEISLLEKCTGLFNGCYTSVINASEVFTKYTVKGSLDEAKQGFSQVGILGIPFRYSVKISEVMGVIKKKS